MPLGVCWRVAWRAIQGLGRWSDRRLAHPVALVGTVVVVTLAVRLFMQHVAWHGFRSWASTADSPASFVTWETLGRQGRRFVVAATAPSSCAGSAARPTRSSSRSGLRRQPVGWLAPDAATAIEHLYGGDTAIVSMQYSYLPTWIAFLIDRQASAPAGSCCSGSEEDAAPALPGLPCARAGKPRFGPDPAA